MKKLLKIFVIYILFFCSSLSLADDHKQNIQNIYKLLQEKKFEEGLKNLQILSEYNEINAQLLYSKILFSGDLTPQDFENSYFWGFAALLGGLKKSSNILKKLEKYLTEKQIEEIKIKLREFLEKRAFAKDKKAIIQIAKIYENYTEPPDLVNACLLYTSDAADE